MPIIISRVKNVFNIFLDFSFLCHGVLKKFKMFCKEGGSVLVSLQSGRRAGVAGNTLSVKEDDWERPLCPFFRFDLLLNLYPRFQVL